MKHDMSLTENAILNLCNGIAVAFKKKDYATVARLALIIHDDVVVLRYHADRAARDKKNGREQHR